MLVDEVEITIKAGNGGNGAVSFKRNAQTPRGGPDGGNGGNGGNIYFLGINDITALDVFRFKKSLKADDGVAGAKYNLYGKNAKDLIIKVPIGTYITNLETNQIVEVKDDVAKILLAKGGQGGKGNREFRTSINQAPRYAEKGTNGEEKTLKLNLKIIADVGLIGLPNAGKSSLLAVLTNANPKIGNYPFTTLEPNLGVLKADHKHIVLADIPGLIEGASHGKGLGIKFLKHIEKTKILLHCIDSTEKDIMQIYNIVRDELEGYSKTLLEKPEIILLTKMDLIDEKEIKEKIKIFKKPSRNALACEAGGLKKEVITLSIYNEESINNLKKILLEKS